MRSILTALQEGRLFELPEPGEKSHALGFLARILDANPDIEVGTDTIEEINKREEECNTGIGMGVGVPHVRARRDEGELFCAIGWSATGVDYGAEDGEHVHLVVMYYIPGAQKNVYLKEISSLIKAIRKTGGIDPIIHATDLNDVRNLLLDWVAAVAGEAGPESVARMIKLEVKQAQSAALPPPGSGGRRRACPFSVLVAPSIRPVVLAQAPELATALEQEAELAQKLAAGTSLVIAQQQIYVTSITTYAHDRLLYACVTLSEGT